MDDLYFPYPQHYGTGRNPNVPWTNSPSIFAASRRLVFNTSTIKVDLIFLEFIDM